MNRVRVFGILGIALFGVLLVVGICGGQGPVQVVTVKAQSSNPNSGNLTMQVEVYDVDLINQRATLVVYVSIGPVDVDSPTLTVELWGGGEFVGVINRTNNEAAGYYEGFLAVPGWYLPGTPEEYPFDSYTLNVTVETSPSLVLSLDDQMSIVSFQGDRTAFLRKTFNTIGFNMVPTAFPVGDNPQVAGALDKHWWAGLPLMLPIWAAYGFLGASFFLGPEKLSEKLTLFTSLFVFVPVLLFAIEPSTPVTASFNVAETLMLILLAVVGTLAALSMAMTRVKSLLRVMLAELFSLLASELGIFYVMNATGLVTHPPGGTSFYLALGLFPVIGALAIWTRNRERKSVEEEELREESQRSAFLTT